MLSTEKWDNWGKDSLLVRFTALTCDENRIFTQNVTNLLAQSVDKTDAVRSFITRKIFDVTIVTLIAFDTLNLLLTR